VRYVFIFFRAKKIFKEKAMDSNKQEYGKNCNEESEPDSFDMRMKIAIRVNRNVHYAYTLIDKLNEYREKLMEGQAGYNEIEMERKITNYLLLALDEFSDNNP
jgi:hypothetical protein